MTAYLDWAATSPPDPEIINESARIALSSFGNPSSLHTQGKNAARVLLESRERCARALGVSPDTLVFTSGGTESNYLPMLSLIQRPVRGTIAISAIEHQSTIEQARMMEHTGWKTLIIPVTRDGFVTPQSVLDTIRDDTAFVSIMGVNNEMGAIQPIKEIAEGLIRHCQGKKKPHFHVDSVQAIGKIPLALSSSGIDSASISAHKLQGPRGIGLLYLSRRVEPFIRGGGQEFGLRPGTENISGAWALSRVLEQATSQLGQNLNPSISDSVAALSDYLLDSLIKIEGVSIVPDTRHIRDIRFSPWIIQCTNRSLPGEVLVRSLSDQGISISTGSACSSKKKDRPVLQAMHIDPALRQNAFRISIGPTTTMDEIKALLASLSNILDKL